MPTTLPGRLVLLLLAVCTLGLPACSTLRVHGELPPGITLTRFSAMDADGPFAWSGTGRQVALANSGLQVRSVAAGDQVTLDAASPLAIAWAPGGDRLSAAFIQGEQTLLRNYRWPGGERLAETVVPGVCNGLFWGREREVVILTSTLQRYTFGMNLKSRLFRWDGTAEPVAALLQDVTLKPLTVQQWGGVLSQLLHPALSPLGDELLFTRLHDPPAFFPYLKLIQYHLETGSERELEDLALTSAGGRYLATGEELLFGDGRDQTRRVNPWSGQTLASWPLPGRTLAASADGRYLWLDGRLFQDQQQLLELTGAEQGTFHPQGTALLLRGGNALYVLQGLSPAPAPAPLDPARRDQLLLLRKWRSGGLISPEDYLQQLPELRQ